jgi:hypothetical protein
MLRRKGLSPAARSDAQTRSVRPPLDDGCLFTYLEMEDEQKGERCMEVNII